MILSLSFDSFVHFAFSAFSFTLFSFVFSAGHSGTSFFTGARSFQAADATYCDEMLIRADEMLIRADEMLIRIDEMLIRADEMLISVTGAQSVQVAGADTTV